MDEERAGLTSGEELQGSNRRSSWRWFPSFLSATLEDFRLDVKEPEVADLERWRKSSLVLNANRRFRYTANLQKRVKNLDSLHKFRVGGLALEALRRFKLALPGETNTSLRLAEKEGFSIGYRDLELLVDKANKVQLEEYGSVEGLATMLKTSLQEGLDGTPEDIGRRQAAFGTNTLPEKPPKGFFGFVWDAAQDVTLMILAFCAVVSIAVGIPTEGIQEGWYDGAGIGFSIILVVLVTAASDYQQSLQFQKLDAEKKKVYQTVLRSGKKQKLLVFDIVVGDVVILSIGDIVPVDGVFIDGNSLIIDESSMTGESEPAHKGSDDPFVQAGTKVQDGSATILVTGVGLHTQWGHLMATLSEDGDDETPLQVKLSGVATLVGNLGLVVAGLVFVVLIARFFISAGFTYPAGSTLKIVEFFAIAVTIIVVAVPEGLPLAVTLTLAYAMKQMMNDMALVRKLAACETMGSATTICSDKTGTLTTNQMKVVRAWVGGKVHNLDRSSLEVSERLVHLMFENIFQNSEGDVHADGHVHGNPTESAILRTAIDMGGDFRAVRKEAQVVTSEPFNSKRKRMAVVVKLPDGRYRAHWKGAGEIVLGMCDKMAGPNGEVVPMEQGTLGGVVNGFAEDALRTLSLAYKDLHPREVPNGEWPQNHPIPASGLTLLGIVGIKDPLRPGVKDAVKLCQSAGIKVRMVTGDNITTAKAIARECGIFTDGEAIEGPDFRDLSPEQMRELIPKLQVMARSSPSDKHTLVHELRAMGEVVAVTGDGTNDAPALKESDIGLAMGIAGTEVAKDSADIIVLDDNFATIVQVAKWGRSVFANIQKFVQFQLTVNIVALVVNFVSACLTGSAPLTAVQLLWVNLIMDTLGALALATEPPDDALMQRPPIGRSGRIISNIMWRNVFGQAIYQLLVLGVLQYQGKTLLNLTGPNAEAKLNTLIFNSFVFCQVFNEVNSREMEKVNVLRGLHRNPMFNLIILVTVVFQIILVEYLGKFASTVPLTLQEWGICVAIGFLGMPIAVVVKFIPVPKDGKSSWESSEDDYHELPDGESNSH